MILVTGATGFLGSEVALQLVEQGNKIRCSKRESSVIPLILVPYHAQIEWVNADLADIFALGDALQGITRVYNCAAWVSLKRSDKKAMIKANVGGTSNLVNLCLDLPVRLVHVSSVAAIGMAKPGDLITENHYLDAGLEDDGYAISKLESEMEIWRGIAEGLDAVIVNPAIIIGKNAGDNGSGELFAKVRQGFKFYTKGTCGFVDVADVAKCMIALMDRDIHGERYIISAENRDFKSVMGEIARGYGLKTPGMQASPWMMGLAWRGSAILAALTGNDPYIDKISALSAIMVRDYDNSKIRKATGIIFKPVNETIKEICKKKITDKSL